MSDDLLTPELMTSAATLRAFFDVELPFLGFFIALHGDAAMTGVALSPNCLIATNGDVILGHGERTALFPAAQLAERLAAYEANKTDLPTTDPRGDER